MRRSQFTYIHLQVTPTPPARLLVFSVVFSGGGACLGRLFWLLLGLLGVLLPILALQRLFEWICCYLPDQLCCNAIHNPSHPPAAIIRLTRSLTHITNPSSTLPSSSHPTSCSVHTYIHTYIHTHLQDIHPKKRQVTCLSSDPQISILLHKPYIITY